MPASPAQIEANRRNAAKSTGPSAEGKLRSRGNALKHGLTGAGVVLPEADAAEVDRRAGAYAAEMRAEGEVGAALARRMAVHAVRMDRCAAQEVAAVEARVREAFDGFVPPDGVGEEEAEVLREEAANLALFDPSKDAGLARKYEAAAERGFFRAMKELRQRGREAASAPAVADAVAEERASLGRLASFFPAPTPKPATPPPAPARVLPSPVKAAPVPPAAREPFRMDAFDVPMTIGRGR